MNDLDDLLRAALRETASGIRAEQVPPLRLPGPGRVRGRLGRRPGWLAPLASAAAVAAVVSGTLAVSRVVGEDRAPGAHPHQSPVIPGMAHPATVDGLPPFFAAASPPGLSSRVVIASSATGAPVATVQLPGTADAVAAGSDGRTFYAAVPAACDRGHARPGQQPCRLQSPQSPDAFYRITVTTAGTALAKLPIRPLARVAAISPSPDGSRLAVMTYSHVRRAGRYATLIRTLLVASTRTGRLRMWTTAQGYSSNGWLSWLADRRTVTFGWYGGPSGAGHDPVLRLLDTTAPGRDLLAGRTLTAVGGLGGAIQNLAVSPDGSTVAATADNGPGTLDGRAVPQGSLVSISPGTGKVTGVTFVTGRDAGGTYLYCRILWISHDGRRILLGCGYQPAGAPDARQRILVITPGSRPRQLSWPGMTWPARGGMAER